MPDYTTRLNLPKPLGNEVHSRANHNALVDAIEANAASLVEVQAAQATADAAQAAVDDLTPADIGAAPASHEHSPSQVGIHVYADGETVPTLADGEIALIYEV